MQLHGGFQGCSCSCSYQFSKQPTLVHHALCHPSLLNHGQHCGLPWRSSESHGKLSRRTRSRCFSRSNLEPQQGKTQPPPLPPEARAAEETVSSRQGHAAEPQAQEQLQAAIRHAASLRQLRSLLAQVQQCHHEQQEGSPGASGQRMFLFTMFLRTGKLLLHRQKDLDRSFLQRLRAMARPNQQRPGLNMPMPSSTHPNPFPATRLHPMQQQQSALKQQMEGTREAAHTLQTGQGSSRRGRLHANDSTSDDSSTAHTLLQSMLCSFQPWLAEAQPHEAAYILMALGAAQRFPHDSTSSSGSRGGRLHADESSPAHVLQQDALQGKGAKDVNEEESSSSSSSSNSDDSSNNSSKNSSNNTGSSGANVGPYAAEAQLLLQAVQPFLLEMKPSHLARVIWGAGAVGVKPSPGWMHAAEQRCAACSTSFGTSSCLLLIEGWALMQHQPHPGLLSDLAHSLKPHLAWLTPAELTNLLHSLAVLDFVPPPTWLHQFFQHSSSKVPGFTPTQFAQVSSALARLRYVPPLWWVRRFMHYSHRCMGFFPATELAVTAYSLVRLNLVPPRAWLHDSLGVLRALPPPPGAGMPKKTRPGDAAGQQQLLQQQQQQQQQHHPPLQQPQQPQQQQQPRQQQLAAKTPLPWPRSQFQAGPSLSTSSPLHPPLQPSRVPPLYSVPQLRPPPHIPFSPVEAPSFSIGAPSVQDSQARPLQIPSNSSKGSRSSTSKRNVAGAYSSNAARGCSSSSSNSDGASSAGNSPPEHLSRSTMPLFSRQVGSKVPPPQNHVKTLADTARRRSLRLGSRGREGVGGVWVAWQSSKGEKKLQIGSRTQLSGEGKKLQIGKGRMRGSSKARVVPQSRGALGSTHWSNTQRRAVGNRGSIQGRVASTQGRTAGNTSSFQDPDAVFQSLEAEDSAATREEVTEKEESLTARSGSMPAAAAPTAEPSLRQHTSSSRAPAAHDGFYGTGSSRWRPPVPLSLPDTFRAVYVVAKLRKDPAVERHVTWARARLPRLLSSVGAIPAHDFYPQAFSTPLSRSTARPTHMPQRGPRDGTRFPGAPSPLARPAQNPAISTALLDVHRPPPPPSPPRKLTSPAALPPEDQSSPLVANGQLHHLPPHTNAQGSPSPGSPLHQLSHDGHLAAETHVNPQNQLSTQRTHAAPGALPTPAALPKPAVQSTSALPRHQRRQQQTLHPHLGPAVQQQQQQPEPSLLPAPHLQQQLLVDLMYLCAELKHQPKARDMARLLQLTHLLLPSLSPSNCVTVLVCMAVLNASVSGAWTSAFSRRLQGCMPSLHATDLAKACIAAAHLRLDVGDEFLKAIEEHTARLDLVQLAALVRSLDGSHAASNVVWLNSLRQQAKRLFASRA